MIIVPIKEGENIERALKKFKRKFEKTGTLKELRYRQAFVKPSIQRRENKNCLLYTSDAADDLLCVDLGGRRTIKKKLPSTYPSP